MEDDVIHLDFETFSKCNLKMSGAYRYARDKSTEILCASWALNEEEPQVWVPWLTVAEAKQLGLPTKDYEEQYQPDPASNGWVTRKMKAWHYGRQVPKELDAHVARGTKILAHNAQMERSIWQEKVVKVHGGTPTKVRQFGCTAARSAAAGLPRSLDGAGKALGTTDQKDKEGSALIKTFCMPRKPTKHDDRERMRARDLPHDFKRLVQYCQQDVRTERAIDRLLPELHPTEQYAFWFDMQINERGLLIDIPLVQKASEVVARLESDIVAEFRELTKSDEYPEGLKPTQRDKVLKVFHDLGIEVENMQAAHVRKYMKNNINTLSEKARRLLLLRMEAGKASTKKLASMMAFCHEDHRARGTLLFYGAHTGRWSGKGIQPHNFIRGTLKFEEQLRIFELLGKADHELFSMLYEWPITAISQCMRGFIIPTSGKIMRVVDYSSIEARVLAWLAQEMGVLKAYAEGKDVYKVMAAQLYSVPYDQVTSEQRRIGKNLVLGCVGRDTEVLTDERGWVKIQDVTSFDMVWDGVEFVRHGGVKWQYKQEVVNVDGVLLTPDHLVFDGLSWLPASAMAGDSTCLKSALNSAILPSSHTGSARTVVRTESNVAASAVRSSSQSSITWLQDALARVTGVPSSTPLTGWRMGPITHNGSTTILWSARYTDLTELKNGWTAAWRSGVQAARSAAVSAWAAVTSSILRFASGTATTVVDFLSTWKNMTTNGSTASGTTCGVALVTSLTADLPWRSLTSAGSHLRFSLKMQDSCRGMNMARTNFSLIGSTTSVGTVGATADSVRSRRISRIEVQTYDILECGPRSQFVIRTRSGSLIVHNCGYGLGAAKFVSYSEAAGVEITEEFAKVAVRTYRNAHRAIVKYWGDVERSAITAVREKRTKANAVVLRCLRFYVQDQWLCIELPVGRCLRYYRPKVVPVMKFGEPSLQLNFKTEFRGQLHSESTYGGKLVENITQAVARDLLVNGMFEAERAGYTVMGTVHDEILSEQHPDAGSVHELEQVVCRLPKWAEGLPVAAEGFESYRYRKG